MYKRDKTPGEIADLIDGFIFRDPSDLQSRRDLEWYGMLDCGVTDPVLNALVKECERINAEFIPDSSLSFVAQHERELVAEQRLKEIAAHLRAMERQREQK